MFRSWERLGERLKGLDWGDGLGFTKNEELGGPWKPVQRLPSQGRLGGTDFKTECGIMGVNSKFNIVQCSKEPFSLWSKDEAISLDIRKAVFLIVPVYF